MSARKFSQSATASLQAAGEQRQSFVVRGKVAPGIEAEARPLFEALQAEGLATRRAQLLSHVHKRYGKGAEFGRNFSDSRKSANARLAAATKGHTLWLADAVLVTMSRREIEELAKDPQVEWIGSNRQFPVPEVLRTPLEDTPRSVDGSTWGLGKIQALEVWGGFGRGAGVRVGHLDTGVDAAHPALVGRVAAFQEFDVFGAPVASAAHDSHFHGTHTAGTICGRNFNGINIGVAPDAQLYSALVLNGGSGSFAQIIAGMQWCITQNVHVVNMSLGGSGYTPAWNLPVLLTTLTGALVVASIGNSGHGTSGGPGNDVFSLGVGATHDQEAVAGFSGGQTLVSVPHVLFGNVSYMKPDISGPGVQVLSCVPNGGIASLNGTSMAAPHVAGVAALIMSAAPALMGQPLAVRSVLLGTIEDHGEAGRDQRFGFGRVDALSSVETAISVV